MTPTRTGKLYELATEAVTVRMERALAHVEDLDNEAARFGAYIAADICIGDAMALDAEAARRALLYRDRIQRIEEARANMMEA